MKNSGFAIHYYHDTLIEYCYDYKERVEAIKETKPLNEIEIRLRLFKILPEKAIEDMPVDYKKAYQKRQDADQKSQGAFQKSQGAFQKCLKAYQEWEEEYQKCQDADQKWSQADKDAFHKKWCGCKEWDGKEIVFPKEKSK